MHDRLRNAIDRWTDASEADLRTGVTELAIKHKVLAEDTDAPAYSGAVQLADSQPTIAVISGANIDKAQLAVSI